jgi:Ras-related protein Rab-1A
MEPSMDESSSIEEDFDEKIKIMLIGDSNVGKTSLLKKYIDNEYSKNYITTVGMDFQMKCLNINNKKIKLQIWDTAGEERYRIVAKNYFNSSDGFIIVYDITKRLSFDNVNNWI